MATKQPLNMTVLSRKLGECYVARLRESIKVLAHAKSANEVIEKVKNRPEFKKNKVVISWIPKYGARYVFGEWQKTHDIKFKPALIYSR